MDKRCFNCGGVIVWRQDVKGHPFYRCSGCGELRFFYDGIRECCCYVKRVATPKGFTGYCSTHGVRVFRPIRYDIYGDKIEEEKNIKL